MAWFQNHYVCARCGHPWSGEWSATCDDDCPSCGARHMSPTDSDDLSERIETAAGVFTAWRSPESAQYDPAYELVGSYPTLEAAQQALAQL